MATQKERARKHYLAHKDAVIERTKQYYQDNKATRKKQSAAWNKAHPENASKCHLKSRYNITPEEKEKRIEKQGWHCAICGRDNPGVTKKGKTKKWCTDH